LEFFDVNISGRVLLGYAKRARYVDFRIVLVHTAQKHKRSQELLGHQFVALNKSKN